MTDKLSLTEIKAILTKDLPNWEYDSQTNTIQRLFKFENYYKCLAFVNALAFYAHRKDHHPDLYVTYNTCLVKYSTHSSNGITKKDIYSATFANSLA
ncbi:MAG: hypothetical protein A3F18_05310 [Legionellales bacterium RIFCSPHIGHO2_12_FULL_37_14]|nr:MAG: hypothetical protein A3F18_05310 [Legionellales bacterium RIFCSPHIGHO2_12_FULL_37_14]